MPRNSLSVVAIFVLLILVFAVIKPSVTGEDQGPVVGEYVRFGLTNALTEEHVTLNGQSLMIQAPALTSEVRIDDSFVESILDSWSTSLPFTVHEEQLIFEAESVTISPFEISTEPSFTWGNEKSVQFSERPMWLNYSQDEPGSEILLHMDDGNDEGQVVFVSRFWLMSKGLRTVNVFHENGNRLAANLSEDQRTYEIFVPHFSYVVLTDELDARGSIGGAPQITHNGEKRWYHDKMMLEIDVGDYLVGYELFVEKEWLTINIPCASANFPSTDSTQHGKEYYSFYFDAEETPTTVVFTSHDSPVVRNAMPPDRSINVEPGTNTLSWHSDVETATNWTVRIEDARYRCKLSVDAPQCSDLAVTSCDVELAPGRTYYWQAVDESHDPPVVGPVWTFRTNPNYGPTVATLLSPQEGAVLSGTSTQLEWAGGHTHDKPVQYSVLIEAWTRSPETPASSCSGIAETYCAISNLVEGTRYFWRVVSYDGQVTRVSSTRSLITDGAPATHAGNVVKDTIVPAPGQLDYNETNVFWQTQDPNAVFDVYLEIVGESLTDDEQAVFYFNGSLPGLSSLVCENVANGCELAGLETGTLYRWAIVPHGATTEGYTEFRFATSSQEGVRMVSPAADLPNARAFAYLYWDGPTSADLEYHVYLRMGSSDWELECVTSALYCQPRDLELGRVYNWRIDMLSNGALVDSTDDAAFGITVNLSHEDAKTALFFGGWKQTGYKLWKPIRNLLIGDGGLEPAYDHVYAVAFYGSECGIDGAIDNGFSSGKGMYADVHHKEIKHWRHEDKSTSCGHRYHWSDTHIEHLAYHVAWYLYKVHTRYDITVDIAAHSMGGLLIRYVLALLAMDHDGYESTYDRMEFPKYCGGFGQPDCRFETYSTRGEFWPDEVAIKDVVTWGTAHDKGFYCPCPVWNLQTEQISSLGSSRFMDWLDEHAQSPDSQSSSVGMKTHWTLVGARKAVNELCDSIAPLNRALGMDNWWVKFHYKEPCYRHSAAFPTGTPVYYEDADIAQDGAGFVWIAANPGSDDARTALEDLLGGPGENESGALHRTGHWLWQIGSTTWSDYVDEPSIRW